MDAYPHFILFCIIFLISSCSETDKPHIANKLTGKKLPSHIKEVENLSVYPIDKPAPNKIKLVKEQVYESNKEVIINGYIGPVAVDNSGRIYIAGQKPGAVGIYVFGPKGSYLTTISQHGRGPGEYESIGTIKIRNNKLWILDPRLQKIGLFSLKDYTHIKDEVINKKEERDYKNVIHRLRGNDLFVTDQENLLLRLSNLSLNKPNDSPVILLHKLSNDGDIIPGSILKLDRFQFYFPKKKVGRNLPFPMPFTRSSIITVTREGEYYTAWTEDFLIKKYDKNGNYLHAFYYPVTKSKLSIKELDISKSRQKTLDLYEMPEYWPALHTMELDDEGHLWVFTITESDTSYKGWVLDKKGKMLATFDWAGQRAERTVMSEPNIIIKDGYLYAQEQNIKKGIDRIVKYKIKIISQ